MVELYDQNLLQFSTQMQLCFIQNEMFSLESCS